MTVDAAINLIRTNHPAPSPSGIAITAAALIVTTLLGIGLDAALGWWWADPAASLAVVYFAIKEGRKAQQNWGFDRTRCATTSGRG